jgi:hypothetical protein
MRYPLEVENVKEILHDVLNELYYSKGKRELIITIGDSFALTRCITWRIVDSAFHNKIK